jgi:hypothetical protein
MLHIGLVRFSTAQFLISLVLLFTVTPFLDRSDIGRVIDGALISLVLMSGVLAVGWRRRTFVVAGLLMLPALAGKWLSHFRPDLVRPEVYLACGLAFIVFVAIELMQFVLRAPRVNSEVLSAGISNYLLLGLMWALAYQLVAQLVPHSFALNGTPVSREELKPFDMFYFSFVTMTTVGYGDITPLSQPARMLAILEAMTGTLYLGVFIARLVALYTSEGIENTPANDQSGMPPKKT